MTPEKQPEISTTEYARMIKKEDGKIDWTKSAVEIERQIRAMSPWPSAFTKVNGKNLKIWDAKVIAMFGGDLFSKIPGQNPTKSAGKVWVADETGLHVKTGRRHSGDRGAAARRKETDENRRFPARLCDRAGYQTWRIKEKKQPEVEAGNGTAV